jgi:hypothetical protein
MQVIYNYLLFFVYQSFLKFWNNPRQELGERAWPTGGKD